jgi:hypothetical protein
VSDVGDVRVGVVAAPWGAYVVACIWRALHRVGLQHRDYTTPIQGPAVDVISRPGRYIWRFRQIS